MGAASTGRPVPALGEGGREAGGKGGEGRGGEENQMRDDGDYRKGAMSGER